MIEDVLTKTDKDENKIFQQFKRSIQSQIDDVRKENMKNYELYLKGQDINPRHCGVLMPTKNIVVPVIYIKPPPIDLH